VTADAPRWTPALAERRYIANIEMKKVLTLAAVAELATGMALLIMPPLVGRLLLGVELSGVAIPVARVLGIALIALGVACWPGRTALCGMLTYNALGAVYFAWLAIRGEWVGPLLWPAVVLHAILAALLARAWLQLRKRALPDEKMKQ
jgi:hypothetical protein